MKRESPIPLFEEGRTWREIYDHIRQRCSMHEERVIRRHTRYKYMAGFFNVLIPVVALALTIVVTITIPYRDIVAAVIAAALTILTTLNSVLEPSKKYSEYASLGVKLHDLSYDLESRLQSLGVACYEAEALKLLAQKNEELSQIGRKMIGIDIPGATAIGNLI